MQRKGRSPRRSPSPRRVRPYSETPSAPPQSPAAPSPKAASAVRTYRDVRLILHQNPVTTVPPSDDAASSGSTILHSAFSSLPGQVILGVLIGIVIYRLLQREVLANPALVCKPAHWNPVPHANVTYFFKMVLSFLTIASVAVALMRLISGKSRRELELRMYTWWVLLGSFMGSYYFFGDLGLLALWAIASLLAFHEFLNGVKLHKSHMLAVTVAFIFAIGQFYAIIVRWLGLYYILVPVIAFLLLPVLLQLGGPQGFLDVCAAIQYGLMETVFLLGHIPLLLLLPDCNPNGGNAGYVVYLVVLTEFNDVAQFISGKSLGRKLPYKMAPTITPSKTWVGLVGGIIITTALAIAIAPVLTPFDNEEAFLVGILISVSGTIGGLGNSAVKRDIGVKDSGTLLPGHGGIIDRIDSLTYAAPLFFHFVNHCFT